MLQALLLMRPILFLKRSNRQLIFMGRAKQDIGMITAPKNIVFASGAAQALHAMDRALSEQDFYNDTRFIFLCARSFLSHSKTHSLGQRDWGQPVGESAHPLIEHILKTQFNLDGKSIPSMAQYFKALDLALVEKFKELKDQGINIEIDTAVEPRATIPTIADDQLIIDVEGRKSFALELKDLSDSQIFDYMHEYGHLKDGVILDQNGFPIFMKTAPEFFARDNLDDVDDNKPIILAGFGLTTLWAAQNIIERNKKFLIVVTDKIPTIEELEHLVNGASNSVSLKKDLDRIGGLPALLENIIKCSIDQKSSHITTTAGQLFIDIRGEKVEAHPEIYDCTGYKHADVFKDIPDVVRTIPYEVQALFSSNTQEISDIIDKIDSLTFSNFNKDEQEALKLVKTSLEALITLKKQLLSLEHFQDKEFIDEVKKSIGFNQKIISKYGKKLVPIIGKFMDEIVQIFGLPIFPKGSAAYNAGIANQFFGQEVSLFSKIYTSSSITGKNIVKRFEDITGVKISPTLLNEFFRACGQIKLKYLTAEKILENDILKEKIDIFISILKKNDIVVEPDKLRAFIAQEIKLIKVSVVAGKEDLTAIANHKPFGQISDRSVLPAT